MTNSAKLATFIQRQQEKRLKRDQFIARERADSEMRQIQKDSMVLPNLKRASTRDYRKWLKGFLATGGNPTHYYDYPMPDNLYIATKCFTILPLYGSMSINIIVPKGIEVLGHLGHCNLYLMDNFRNKGGWIPVYRDTIC